MEEEELQMKAEPITVQRQGMDEEELFPGKMEPLQRQDELEEEEELLQGKFESIQRQDLEDEELIQGKFATGVTTQQFKNDSEQQENRTGMPDNLKAGIENLSGMSMDDVNVHYHSSNPAQLNALAYTQGTDIHVGPGQEKHLPHEAWHVVQHKQGRVKSTVQSKGVLINDDEGLEHEADVMATKAMQKRHSEKSVFKFPIHKQITEPIQRVKIKLEEKDKALMDSLRQITVPNQGAQAVDSIDQVKGLDMIGVNAQK